MSDQGFEEASAQERRPQTEAGVAVTPSDDVIRVVAYYSLSPAPAGYEAVAYIWLDGERLPVVFAATTPMGAEAKARAHWAAQMVKHGASMANRAEGRRRAAETRARKAAQLQSPQPNHNPQAPGEPA